MINYNFKQQKKTPLLGLSHNVPTSIVMLLFNLVKFFLTKTINGIKLKKNNEQKNIFSGCSIMVVRVPGGHVAPVRFRAARPSLFFRDCGSASRMTRSPYRGESLHPPIFRQ